MSTDTELALVASLLVEPGQYDLVVDVVADTDFDDPLLGKVFKAVGHMAKAGRGIDIVTVCELLTRHSAETDWMQVCALASLAPYAAVNAPAYAETIKARARARVFMEIASSAASRVEKDPDAVDDGLREFAAMDSDTSPLWDHVGVDVMREAAEESDRIASGKVSRGLPTGLSMLDKTLGGMHPTDLSVVGGRPGMGKTSFLVNLAMAQQCPVGFMSIEMPAVQIGAKLISATAWLDYSKFRRGGITADDGQKIVDARAKLQGMTLYICDKPTATMADVWGKAAQWRRKHGVGLLIIDYLQRIRTPTSISRYDAVSSMVSECKMLARQLGIPVVVGAQLNRKLEERADKRPMNSDLRESGAIEQEADQIIMLYRESMYTDNADESQAEVIITKNRHGEASTVTVGFNPAAGRFYDRAFGSSAPPGPPPQD